MVSSVKIGIGGDFCPQGANLPATTHGEPGSLFGDVLHHFQAADISILNLECPLVDAATPAPKAGPTLGVPTACSSVLASSGVRAVGLANNHLMDHGQPGLDSTLRALQAAGIQYFGAGSSLEEAGRILIVERRGLRLGLLAMAEHEFGVATRRTPGVNPLDLMGFVRSVRAQKNEYDHLIVLLHGGNEHAQYPRPSLVETCRFLVDEGASAVLCQHSHCVGCYENYHGGHIVYGQGNLLFDMGGQSADWYSGLFVELDVQRDGTIGAHLIPFRQSRPEVGIHRMSDTDEAQFLADLQQRSEMLRDPDRLDAEWDNYCRKHQVAYLRRLGTHNKLLRGLDRLTGYARWLYGNETTRLSHLNLLRCESHREALVTILSNPVSRKGPQ